MNALVRVVAGCSLAVLTGWAASWDSVVALQPGQKVRVETTRLKLTGQFSEATQDQIKFRSERSDEVAVSRTEVRRVYVERRGRRIWNIVIGSAVGAAAGIALYATIGRIYRNEGGEAGHLLVIPVAAGTAAGAAFPDTSMKRIYDSGR